MAFSKPLLGVIVGVLIIGGVVFASQSSAPAVPPAEALSVSLQKVGGIEAVHIQTKTVLKLADFNLSSVTLLGAPKGTDAGAELTVSVDGDLDIKDSADVSGSFKIAGNLQSVTPDSPVYAFSLETRQRAATTYLKVTEVPAPFQAFAAGLLNQWLTIKTETIPEIPESLSGSMILTAEQRNALVQAVVESEAITVKEELPSESAGGVSARVFALLVDKSKLVGLNARVSEILGKSFSAKEKEALMSELDHVTFDDVRVWVGKRDQYIHKISVSGIAAGSKDTGKVSFTHVLEFSDFNDPIRVEVPADAKPIEQVLGATFGGLMQAR